MGDKYDSKISDLANKQFDKVSPDALALMGLFIPC